MSEYDLSRFERAQNGDYHAALREIKSGRKRSHWMWYIFPQLKGLGYSGTARFYGIDGIGEARDYLAHPLLGSRLREISAALLELETDSASDVFGYTDALKLRSCMTLFDTVEPDSVFRRVLEKYYGGIADSKSLEMLDKM